MQSTHQLPELFQMLQPHFRELDAFLLNQVENFEPEIREQVAYCIDTSGKRIRPSLIFFSGWTDESTVDPNLVRLATVIETIHLATLVHDDIMDRADIRRNRDTAAIKFGNTAAVLMGDALFSHAVFLATQFPTTEVCERVSVSMRKVCSGEIMQTMQRGDPDITLELYERVIDLKTAELFHISCFLGGLLTKDDPAYATAAGDFGRHLGIAYQIYDDLTDLFGSQEKIGKTLGTDIATGKATLPLILMRDRLDGEQKDALRNALSGKSDVNTAHWLDKLSEMGIFEEVKQRIFDEIDTGRAKLESFRQNESANLLLTMSDLLRNQVLAL